MTELHMIQLTPDLSKVVRWAKDQNVSSRDGADDFSYAWHAILTAALGDDAPRPFRIVEKPNRAVQILAYTPFSGDSLKQRAATIADPFVYEALGFEGVASKKMPASFTAGGLYGFEVKCNPIVRDKDGGAEHDVYDWLMHNHPEEAAAGPDVVYLDWLRKKIEAIGVKLQSVKIEQKLSGIALRRDRSNGLSQLKRINSRIVTFRGDLLVEDPQGFHDGLRCGIGRHKAFGQGMVLLRAAG